MGGESTLRPASICFPEYAFDVCFFFLGAQGNLSLEECKKKTRGTKHGCCWETWYIFAYCGLVGNPHLAAKIYLFAPLPTSTK